jgi:uncharacterized membrane protein
MKKWILPIGIIAAALIISVLSYGRMPDQMPIHWNAYGEVDRYASKLVGLFLMPAIMAGVLLLIKIAPIIDPKRANLQKSMRDIDTVNVITLLVLLVVHCVTILSSMGVDINMSVLAPIIAGTLFVFLGNLLPRFKHNYSFGIRTPWTLANEQVWRRSNLIGGRVMFFGGLVMILCAFLPTEWMLVGFFLILAITIVTPLVISYLYFRKYNTNS